MCHRYSVIAPELPIAVNHHTRGRCAHRLIAGAAAIASALRTIACPASNNDGGLMLARRGPRCRPGSARMGPHCRSATSTASMATAMANAERPVISWRR